MKQLKHTDKEMSLLTREFHGKICELTCNKALLKAWQTMSDQMNALAIPVLSHLYRDSNDVARRHQQILKALQSGKIEHAQKVVKEHISQAGQKVIKLLTESDYVEL